MGKILSFFELKLHVYPKWYCESFRCGPLETEHPKRVFPWDCILTCDNKLCECYPLAGGSKRDTCERIVRVPAVMRWKEEITGRQIIRTPVTVMDVMPTVLELLNHSTGAFYSDGKSLLPVLFNLSQESQHKYIFHYVEVTKPAAVTSGPYKAVYTEIKGTGKYQVYEMQQSLCYLGHKVNSSSFINSYVSSGRIGLYKVYILQML